MLFLDWLTTLNEKIGAFVWGAPGLGLLMGTGVVMTCRTRFFQLMHAPHWLNHTLGRLFRKSDKTHRKETGSISQFQALCTALAATIGVGNIAGVAAAIVAGGPGAIFWMWVAALFGMMTGYAENVLGIYYRRRVNGQWAGGAMYYLRDGLGAKPGCRTLGRVLAALFAWFTVLASFGIGNMGQINTLVVHIESAFPLPALSGIVLYEGVTLYALLVGIAMLILIAIILLGGAQRIAAVAEKLVPAMILLYVVGSVWILLINAERIGTALGAILSGAFNSRAAYGGAVGITLRQVIICGCKRGVFSNEAGMGSAVIVHCYADTREPARQGMWSIFEVFVDTIVMCTLTALIILTSGVVDPRTGAPIAGGGVGTTLVAAAFQSVYGQWGEQFVAVSVLLFAFATVLGWSQYGGKAAEYIGGPRAERLYKVVFVLLILSGALLTSSLAWDISDTCNGLMMIPNLIAVLALSGQVRKITQNYVDRRIRHKDVAPLLSYASRLQQQMAAELEDE